MDSERRHNAETIPQHTGSPPVLAASARPSEPAARPGERADALIDRALSGDSRAFLAANVQTGGQ